MTSQIYLLVEPSWAQVAAETLVTSVGADYMQLQLCFEGVTAVAELTYVGAVISVGTREMDIQTLLLAVCLPTLTHERLTRVVRFYVGTQMLRTGKMTPARVANISLGSGGKMLVFAVPEESVLPRKGLPANITPVQFLRA